MPQPQVSGGLVVPDFVLAQPDLKPGAKLLYSALCRCAKGADHCSPSQKHLALWIGPSLRSVQNHLNGLAEAGLIQVLPGKQSKTSMYRLLVRPVEAHPSDRAPAPTLSRPQPENVIGAPGGISRRSDAHDAGQESREDEMNSEEREKFRLWVKNLECCVVNSSGMIVNSQDLMTAITESRRKR